jgi:hypothetical protein
MVSDEGRFIGIPWGEMTGCYPARDTPEAFLAGLVRPAIAGFLAVPAAPGPSERGLRLDDARLAALEWFARDFFPAPGAL